MNLTHHIPQAKLKTAEAVSWVAASIATATDLVNLITAIVLLCVGVLRLWMMYKEYKEK